MLLAISKNLNLYMSHRQILAKFHFGQFVFAILLNFLFAKLSNTVLEEKGKVERSRFTNEGLEVPKDCAIEPSNCSQKTISSTDEEEKVLRKHLKEKGSSWIWL